MDSVRLPTHVLRLEPHPIARSQALATCHLPEGSRIVSIPSLVTVLLASEKGRRCDNCFRLTSERRQLQRCTGCGSYWYCGTQCQAMQWQAHHKKICKLYNQYASSNHFQSLASHEKLDSLLLSHLLCHITSTTPLEKDPVSIFRALLPGPASGLDIAVPPLGSSVTTDSVKHLYSRFGNNNFAIHSHLITVGHGIFPLASRLFNHSCAPNAAAKFIFLPSEPVTMEVVALRDISPDEEVCLPYLDPALLQSRQQIFDLTYGFRCTCSSCQFMETLGHIPSPPSSSDELRAVARMVREFVGINSLSFTGLPSRPQTSIPRHLFCVLHESYLSILSETFSKASHEGQYDLALDSGLTLLAVYVMIYPINYPQIGMHLLELAKSAWNNVITSSNMNKDVESAMKEQVRTFLSSSRRVLTVFGPEGDEDGPLPEVETLQTLLDG
ncbi:SET domain-containing protein [Tricholoma matsutake]|nr:SET domain-containing protein [Tricholoma matsutake 945]